MPDPSKSTLAFVVCSNGYGHLKRVLVVVNEILRIRPSQHIVLFCCEEHVRFADREINFQSDTSVVFDTCLSAAEISWIDPGRITRQAYEHWREDLNNNSVLRDCGLLVSDNHVLPLSCTNRSLLMGSFLWHDATLQSSSETRSIQKEETEYLNNKKPDLICVADMVMPRLAGQTRPIKMPWFCTKYPERFESVRNNRILVTGGGTELINRNLLALIDLVSSSNTDKIFYLDKKLFHSCSFRERKNIFLFDFCDASFSALSAVICRPGVGILTDCVRYSLPAIVLNDSYNGEIEHNATCVSRMGIGMTANTQSLSSKELAAWTNEILNSPETLARCTEALERTETGGAALAAAYILQKLDSYE